MDETVEKRFNTLEEAMSNDRKILQQLQDHFHNLNKSMDRIVQLLTPQGNASSEDQEEQKSPVASTVAFKSSGSGRIFSATNSPLVTPASIGTNPSNTSNILLDFEKSPFIFANKRFEPDFGIIINNKNHGSFSISSMGTQLHFAAANGNIQRVNDLITAGAQIDFRDRDGNTPLVVASKAGHWNVVYYLLQKGARPDINEGKPNAPLRLAMQAGQIDAVRLMLTNAKGGWSDEELIESLALTKSSQVMSVIKDMFPSNVWDRVGSSALLHCARLGFQEAMTALLDTGVNVNAMTSRNNTALQRACGFGHVKCARILIQYGALINTRDNDGDTPLHQAAMQEQDESIHLLLEAGAEKYIRNFQGKTPFEVAHTMTAKILLR